MQLNHQRHTLETDADRPIRQSKINATAQMFKILSSQIYTHKELAIVRELIANAYDAHLVAGTLTTPIQIHMPTPLEPWFEIKDFGTGLPSEQVGPLYMDYGNSDKTHTNELIGGFGVGSKAPFCMTDQFTVVDRYQGTAYTFQAFIQSNGTPGCTQIDQAPTDEPDGLTVYVPIESSSEVQMRFTEALQRVAPYLPTPPISPGGAQLAPPFPLEDYIPTPDLPGCAGASVSLEPNVHTRLLVQGIVPYKIDSSIFFDASADPSLSADARHILSKHNLQFTLFVPIGSFELNVSREALSLDDAARKRLQQLIVQASERAAAKLIERIKGISAWYEGAMLMQQMGFRDATTINPPWFNLPNLTKLGNLRIDDVLQQHDGLTFRGHFITHRCPKGYFHSQPGALSPREFSLADVYIAPKSNYSSHRFARQHFASSPKALLLFTGERIQLERLFKRYAIPNAVRDLPFIATPKTARVSYGKTQYPVFTMLHTPMNGWKVLKHRRLSADELINQADSDLVVFRSSDFDTPVSLAKLGELDQLGLITLGKHRTFTRLELPQSHHRVAERLYRALEGAGASLVERCEDLLKYNQDAVDEAATHKAALDFIDATLNNPRLLYRLSQLLGSDRAHLTGLLGALAEDVQTLALRYLLGNEAGRNQDRQFRIHGLPATIDWAQVGDAQQIVARIAQALGELKDQAGGLHELLVDNNYLYPSVTQPLIRDLSRYLRSPTA